jgi:organic radical activating enzyme
MDDYNAFKNKYPTLCVLPFIQTCCNADGVVQMCNRSENLGDRHVAFNDLDDMRNNEQIRASRKSMIAAQPLAACKRCIDEEADNHLSKRQRENQRFWKKALPYIESAEANDGRVNPESIFWDVKLGSVCNFSCMYCTDSISTSFYSESLKLDKAGVMPEWRRPDFENTRHKLRSDRGKWAEWYLSDEFWDRFNNQVHQIDTIFFEGGEPTLNPKVHEFAKQAVSTGAAKNINIKFATNLTGLTEELLDNLCQFRKVQLIMSIDGPQTIQEYVRYGSDWSVIESKWKMVTDRTNPNLIPILLPCISILNVEYLPETVEWAKQAKRDFQFGINYLSRPEILHLNNMPEERRLAARDRIWSWWQGQHNMFTDPQLAIEMQGLYNVMGTTNENQQRNLMGLRSYLNGLDKVRGTDHKQIWEWL